MGRRPGLDVRGTRRTTSSADVFGGSTATSAPSWSRAPYPVEPHVPLPIGVRTAGYPAGCGLRPVRRWPY